MPLPPLALAALLAAAPDDPLVSEAIEPGEELPAPRRRAAAPEVEAFDPEEEAAPRSVDAFDPDEEAPGRRAPRPEADPDDGSTEEELFREVPRVLVPPGFGRVRFELQAESGVRPGGALDATLGLELRIGLVAPVALALGGGGAFWPKGDPTWAAHATLRAQAPLEPSPWFEGGVALRGGWEPPQWLGGLGVALSLDETQAVSLGARGLFSEAELGVLGVVGLYYAP